MFESCFARLFGIEALNCGVDLARYRYVCTIPDDVEVETDGLLRVSRAIKLHAIMI